jgi:hypothetical protein
MAMSVDDTDNQHEVVVDLIEHTVRKAVHEVSSGRTPEDRPGGWVFTDSCDGALQLFAELSA